MFAIYSHLRRAYGVMLSMIKHVAEAADKAKAATAKLERTRRA
jgi:hypothetical protein